MWKSRPLGSLMIWKRVSQTGWLKPWSKEACFSVWLVGLRRYQLGRSSDQLEKLQVKVAFVPSDTASQAGEKVSLQDPLEASEVEKNKEL